MSSKVKNTLAGRAKGPAASALFSPRTIFLMVIIGVFSFSAFFVLSGFADKFKSGNNGAAHVLSKSAIGFNGLLHLLKQNDHDVGISRASELSFEDGNDLRILSPTFGYHSENMDDVNINSATLIILPKWVTRKDPKHKGWVRKRNKPYPDTYNLNAIETLLHPTIKDAIVKRSKAESQKVTILASNDLGTKEDLKFYNFEKLQTISGKNLIPIIVSDSGTILAKVIEEDIYVLSDPDFLNTHGLAKPDAPEFAHALLTLLQEKTETSGYVFDLSLHGFTRSQNFIKLALTPPFLAATLCLLAMLLLIGWQAFMRFGAPAKTGREIALGKLSLVYNAANFIKLAGREYKMAPDYVKLTKKLAADRLHIPSGLSETELNERLDTYSRHTNTDTNWSALESEATPTNAASLMLAVRKLYKWRGDITHERN